MEGLDKTDDNLLSKINGLQTDNAQILDDIQQNLDNKLAKNENKMEG